jgi:hypothetical protein
MSTYEGLAPLPQGIGTDTLDLRAPRGALAGRLTLCIVVWMFAWFLKNSFSQLCDQRYQLLFPQH